MFLKSKDSYNKWMFKFSVEKSLCRKKLSSYKILFKNLIIKKNLFTNTIKLNSMLKFYSSMERILHKVIHCIYHKNSLSIDLS